MSAEQKNYVLPKMSVAPWHYSRKSGYIFDAGNWGFIGEHPRKEGSGELDAEMQLMAAAPELFDALNRFRAKFKNLEELGVLNCPMSRKLISDAEAALSKAVGENGNS